MKNRLKGPAKAALAALFWLAVWQVAAMAINQELLIVSPIDVIQRLLALMGETAFWHTTLWTLGRIMLGFAIAVLSGIALAVLSHVSGVAHALIQPIMGTVKSTPVASFILLALVWMQTGNVTIFTTFLMVLPIIWANVLSGLRNVDGKLVEMAKVYQFSRGQALLRVYIPSVMPYFIAAFTTGLGLGWKAGIAAEVISLPQIGIGRQLHYAKVYLETPDLFAWTLVVIILSMLLEKSFVLLGKRAGARYNVS